jgi:hypothetical protein
MQGRMSKEKAKKKRTSKLLILLGFIVAFLVVLFLLTAIFYKQIGQKIVEVFLSKKIGGDVQIQDQGKEVTYKSDEGTFSLTEGGKLPSEFPTDFPIYSNATIKNSWSAEGNQTQGVSVVWETADSVDTVVGFFDEQLPKGEWKIVNTFKDDNSTTITFEKDKVNGFVGITKGENDKTTISVSLGVTK